MRTRRCQLIALLKKHTKKPILANSAQMLLVGLIKLSAVHNREVLATLKQRNGRQARALLTQLSSKVSVDMDLTEKLDRQFTPFAANVLQLVQVLVTDREFTQLLLQQWPFIVDLMCRVVVCSNQSDHVRYFCADGLLQLAGNAEHWVVVNQGWHRHIPALATMFITICKGLLLEQTRAGKPQPYFPGPTHEHALPFAVFDLVTRSFMTVPAMARELLLRHKFATVALPLFKYPNTRRLSFLCDCFRHPFVRLQERAAQSAAEQKEADLWDLTVKDVRPLLKSRVVVELARNAVHPGSQDVRTCAQAALRYFLGRAPLLLQYTPRSYIDEVNDAMDKGHDIISDMVLMPAAVLIVQHAYQVQKNFVGNDEMLRKCSKCG